MRYKIHKVTDDKQSTQILKMLEGVIIEFDSALLKEGRVIKCRTLCFNDLLLIGTIKRVVEGSHANYIDVYTSENKIFNLERMGGRN